MPNQNTDAEAALRKLGQRVREGHAMKHPTPEENLKTVKHAVREQYEQEQKAEHEKKSEQDVPKNRGREPRDPEPER